MSQFTLAAPNPWADRWRAPAPLRRAHGMDAVADLIASPGAPGAWINSGKLASAAIASNQIRWTGKSGAGDQCDWTTGNFTAPLLYWPLNPLPLIQQLSWAAHVSTPGPANATTYEMAGLLLREVGSTLLWAEILFGRSAEGGGYQIRTGRAINGAPANLPGNVNLVEADLATGAWLRMSITPTGVVHMDYRVSASLVYPVGGEWTSIGDTAQVFGLNNVLSLEACLMIIATTNPPSGRIWDFKQAVIEYGGGPA